MFCPVVALHTGVGIYEKKSQKEFRRLIYTALERGRSLLQQRQDALDVCTEVCSLLEDSILTNAGIGSNLTRDATVELDALVMTSDPPHLFGAVGALPAFKNPVLVAKKLLQNQVVQNHTGIERLTPPCFMAGDSATGWCLKNNFTPSQNLITQESATVFTRATNMAAEWSTGSEIGQNEENSNQLSNRKEVHKKPSDVKSGSSLEMTSSLFDDRILGTSTVGVIVLDRKGSMCVTSSSGGIVLKESGRCGSSCVYGAGCWTHKQEQTQKGNNESAVIGVTSSGNGEYLIRKQFSSQMCQMNKIISSEEPLVVSFERNWREINKNVSRNSLWPAQCVGCICVRGKADGETEVCWANNQHVFAVGVAGHSDSKQKSWKPRIAFSTAAADDLSDASELKVHKNGVIDNIQVSSAVFFCEEIQT